MTARLFDPYDFCGIRLRNRFVRSATMENLATAEHAPSEALMALYESLAAGQVGLIITSAVRPNRAWDPRAESKNLTVDRDDQIPGLQQLTARVHRHGAKVAIQLGAPFRFKGKLATPSKRQGQGDYRELSIADIQEIIAQYALAAARSRAAGFDALQLNAAHGFLLAQFLSPAYNHRTDRYGGSTVNRARIVAEIVTAIRKRVLGNFPVFIKMNVMDFCDGGITVEEAVRTTHFLAEAGIAAVEASAGGIGHAMTWLGPARRSAWSEGYLRPYTAALKAQVDLPVIMVGGLRSYEMMAEIVARGEADLVAMSRPLIRDAQLVARWQAGDLRPAGCLSCNRCMQHFQNNEVVGCGRLADG